MGLEDFESNEMINKVTGALSGLVTLSGVAMVVGGVVVLAVDCAPAPNHHCCLRCPHHSCSNLHTSACSLQVSRRE